MTGFHSHARLTRLGSSENVCSAQRADKKVVLFSNVRDAAQRVRKLEFSRLSRMQTHPGYCQTCRIGRASLTSVNRRSPSFHPRNTTPHGAGIQDIAE